jgi:spore coat protein CotH
MDKKWILPACCITAFLNLSLDAHPSFAQKPLKRGAQPTVQPAAETGPPEASGNDLWALTESRLFNGEVHKISIRMNQAVWDRLHEDEKRNECRKAAHTGWAHVRDFTINDVIMKNVAIKVRGNSSRCVPRLQFSVSFDKTKGVYTRQGTEDWYEVNYDEQTGAAIKGRTLHGLQELNLRRSYNDSSSEYDSGNGMLAREFVATWASAKAEDIAKTTLRGPPTYRTAYALVEFQFCANDADNACNNRIVRAYLIAEPLDKGFFKMRYDDEKPTFFSMAHGCALRVEKGNEGFTYRCLEPEYMDGKKIDEANAEDLLKALAHINGTEGLKAHVDAAASPSELGKVLDLDSIMNYAAFATTVGHWDSAYGNFNNDVLYFHPPSGKWKLIASDMDDTFDYDGAGGTARSYSYAEVANGTRILFDKLFGMPELDAKFRKHLGNYLTTLYGSNGSDSPLKNKILDARDRYILKTNDELPSTEHQNIERAKEMIDYAKQRLRVLRNQPRPPASEGQN